MFELTKKEAEISRSQIATLKQGENIKYLELRLIIEELRKKTENNTKNIEVVFQYLDELIDKREQTKPRTQNVYKIGKK